MIPRKAAALIRLSILVIVDNTGRGLVVIP